MHERFGEEVSRLAHNQKTIGASPITATKFFKAFMTNLDRIAALGAVAQKSEQRSYKALVDGAIPSCLTTPNTPQTTTQPRGW